MSDHRQGGRPRRPAHDGEARETQADGKQRPLAEQKAVSQPPSSPEGTRSNHQAPRRRPPHTHGKPFTSPLPFTKSTPTMPRHNHNRHHHCHCHGQRPTPAPPVPFSTHVSCPLFPFPSSPPPTLNSDMTWLPPRPPAPPPPKPTLAPSIPSQRTKSANASRNSLIVSSVRSREPRGIVATAIGVGTHQGSSPSRLGAASRRALSKQAHADGVCCTYPPPSHHAAWPAPRAHATVSVEGTRTAVTLQPTRCRTPRRSKYTRREGAHQREPGGTKDVERRAATSTQPPGQQRNHFQPFVARERSRGQGAEQRAAETGK